jgi:hypothetical protein
MGIYEKLLTVQAELKAPKNQTNTFGKYKYRSQEDILEALKPILARIKAVSIISDELVLIGDRYYIKATASLIDAETGDKAYTIGYAREELDKKGMDGSQITGTASSYARKYALNGLYAIDDTKDADALNDHGKDKEEEPKATKGQLDKLEMAYTEATKQKVYEHYKIAKLADLTLKQASELVARLEQKK